MEILSHEHYSTLLHRLDAILETQQHLLEAEKRIMQGLTDLQTAVAAQTQATNDNTSATTAAVAALAAAAGDSDPIVDALASTIAANNTQQALNTQNLNAAVAAAGAAAPVSPAPVSGQAGGTPPIQ